MSRFLERSRQQIQSLSLRKRILVLAGVLVGLVALLISLAAFFTMRFALWHQVDSNLVDRARQMSQSSDAQWQVTLTQIPSEALGAADIRIAVVTANGNVLSKLPPPVGRQELLVAAGVEPESIRTAVSEGRIEYRVVAVPLADAPGSALVLAQDTKSTERVLRLLTWVLGLVATAGVLFAAWAGFEIARTGLRPVEQLTRAAERIAQTGDLRPIPVHGTDELARLTHSFNQMLTALAAARIRERRLVADAGHELRTPLTSLRTNLELLVQSDARNGGSSGGGQLSAEDRAALLDDVRAQVSELSALVTDLVELSRDDPPSNARQQLDFAEVVTNALERVRRRAPNVRLDTVLNPWMVVGDQQALERAVLNLLDNAVKWSPTDGVVTVRLSDGQLTVSDQGPGITDADLPHVFERFYRSAEARTMPGSGLGLAIVRQAVDRHGGVAYAGHSPGGGASFTIRLPGSPPV